MTYNTIKDKYKNKKDCLIFLEEIIWRSKPVCPYCGGINPSNLIDEERYHCNRCNTSFSVTVNTIFHKTKIDLQKWFYAINLIFDENKIFSVRKLAKELRVHKNTAWLLKQKITEASIVRHKYILLIYQEIKLLTGELKEKIY